MGAETPTRMGGRKKGSKVIRREGRRKEREGKKKNLKPLTTIQPSPSWWLPR